MRTKNSIKNATISFIMNFFSIFIGFIAQKIFVYSLGKEYLGINGLFNNVLSVLCVIELGFGATVIYHLYKPIAENNKEYINVLLKFYKKTYRIIAFVIFILGILVMPFLKNIIGEVSITENIYLLFFMALIDVVFSYVLTYKRSILYANQKTYIVNLVHLGYIFLVNFIEIVLLLTLKNYIIYLLIKIIFRVLENIIINIIANKMYPFILEKTEKELDKVIKNDIYKKIKGLLFHRIGGAVVLGTDNIIISKFIGITTVGLYSNYNMIISALTNLLGQIFSSITAGVGNLLVEADSKKAYSVYKNILFFDSWIYSFVGICVLCLAQPFIELWLGDDFLLPFSVLVVLVFNFYIYGMRKTNAVFKDAAGIFYEDRYIPIFESITNIILSVILVKKIGLEGVFIGTSISTMILFLYSYPVFVYKKLFNNSYKEFILIHLKYVIISIITAIITYLIVNRIQLQSNLLTIIFNGLICCIVPNLIYFCIFFKTSEFLYYKNIIFSGLKKK